VQRAEAEAARAGVTLRWRPFSVRTLMNEQNNKPFVGKPAKLKYMWRDVERRALRHGLPYVKAPRYPIDAQELANRMATLAAMQGWAPAFLRAAYDLWFLEDKDPGEPDHLHALLQRLGKGAQAETLLAEADGAAVREQYASETTTARALGIFGSPTFVCGGELFWGDDRLDDAVDWCAAH